MIFGKFNSTELGMHVVTWDGMCRHLDCGALPTKQCLYHLNLDYFQFTKMASHSCKQRILLLLLLLIWCLIMFWGIIS